MARTHLTVQQRLDLFKKLQRIEKRRHRKGEVHLTVRQQLDLFRKLQRNKQRRIQKRKPHLFVQQQLACFEKLQQKKIDWPGRGQYHLTVQQQQRLFRKLQRNRRRRDRKSKRKSTMLQTFTPFPRLPPELRRMIWELCLPSRVVEVHDLDGFSQTSRINTRPPIITRVCVESRLIAFENSGIDLIYKPPKQPLLFEGMRYKSYKNFKNKKRWILLTRDTVCMEWYPLLNEFIRESGSAMPHFMWQASMVQGPPAFSDNFFKKLSAHAAMDLHWSEIDEFRDFHLGLLEEKKDYWVYIRTVSLHISINQALKSELFGRLAEERVKLVGATDSATIKKYYRAWASGPREDQMQGFVRVFAEILQTKRFRQTLRTWLSYMKRMWLSFKWREAEKGGFVGIADSANIWIRGPRPDDDEPNLEHPWTRKILKRMPRFVPKIMFRFCEADCHLDPLE